MSRYYEVAILDPLSNKTIKSWSSENKAPSLFLGTYNPSAQNVEFDLYAYSYAVAKGASTVTIEGVDITDIGQANQWTGYTVTVKGGMRKGLPLANPSQSGTLLTGQVWQGFGNWEGTDMSLDLVILASPYSYDTPGNFVLNAPIGSPLGPAIKTMLQGAFGTSTISVNVNPNRTVTKEDAKGYWHTLEQASQALADLTRGQLCAADPGIQITIAGNGNIQVFDYTEPSGVVTLDFLDFVGQPTWIAPYEIQAKLVLRADLSVGTMVKMPAALPNLPGVVVTQAPSLPSYTNQTAIFQGDFFVTSLRHVGDFRNTHGALWVSIANMVFAGQVGCS